MNRFEKRINGYLDEIDRKADDLVRYIRNLSTQDIKDFGIKKDQIIAAMVRVKKATNIGVV